MLDILHTSAHNLHAIADGTVQMVATSPPYYGLRAYAGEQDVEWPAVTYRLNEWTEPVTVPGCDPDCEHEWTDGPKRVTGNTPSVLSTVQGGKSGAGPTVATQGAYCSRCGGWRGGLGMEPSPVAYIGHLILCLREWRRVLRDDGVCFVNLGDSYAGGGGYYPDAPSNRNGHSLQSGSNQKGERNIKGRGTSTSALKPKDLLGIPWMFAFAARADGWYLRSDIIWSKPNPMPESVTDRPTKAHEYVFLLAKSQRYYWDGDAVREPAKPWNLGRMAAPKLGPNRPIEGARDQNQKQYTEIKGANIRSVWQVATQPTPYAHFATWPESLVERMIRAGSAAGDAVLDPFHGSGTTGKVALRNGRAYIGADISADYIENVTAERYGDGLQIGMGL